MREESLSSISSSPSNSDISLDEDDNKSVAVVDNDDYNTIVLDSRLYLSRLVGRDCGLPALDDFCRILGSAIGNSQGNYAKLLEIALKNIDKIVYTDNTPIEILFRGICQHDPSDHDQEAINSILLIRKLINLLINGANKDAEFVVRGVVNWLIWSTQCNYSKVRFQAILALNDFMEICKSAEKYIELVQVILSSGLAKRVYPIKEIVNYSQVGVWKHLCNATTINGWLYPLMDDHNDAVRSFTFKLLSSTMGFLNENDKKSVIDAAIDCFYEDPQSSHITEILSTSNSISEGVIKRLIKGISGNIENSHFYEQNKAIIQLLDSVELSGRSKQLLPDLLRDSITSVGDYLLYKRYLTNPSNQPNSITIFNNENYTRLYMTLYSNSKNALNTQDCVQLLQIGYPERLDTALINDVNYLNYFNRAGVEFGYTANQSLNEKVVTRFETLLNVEEILDPSFITGVNFIDDNVSNDKQCESFKLELNETKMELPQIVIGKCETFALPGDAAAAKRTNCYYNYTIINKMAPKGHFNFNCQYPFWQLIEFNHLLGYQASVVVKANNLTPNSKQKILLVKYPPYQRKDSGESQSMLDKFTPASANESQTTFKINLHYPISTAAPIPVVLAVRYLINNKSSRGPSREIWIHPK